MMIYTHLISFEEDDEYDTAVALNVDEARKLMAVNFDYVCTHENQMIFRKRK